MLCAIGTDVMDGTTIISTTKQKRILFYMGRDKTVDPPEIDETSTQTILDDYVPVGSFVLSLTNACAFSIGDDIVVERAGSAEWIRDIGMDQLKGGTTPWLESEEVYVYHRKVVHIDTEHCRQLTLNAPIATAIEQRYGGGSVKLVKAWNNVMSKMGIESLLVKSEYEHGTDVNHASRFVYVRSLRDSWIRNVTVQHFSMHAVLLSSTTMHISVIDVKYVDPKGPAGAADDWDYRTAFENRGQLNLFLRCESHGARHAFDAFASSHEPNAFVNCRANGTVVYSVRYHSSLQRAHVNLPLAMSTSAMALRG